MTWKSKSKLPHGNFTNLMFRKLLKLLEWKYWQVETQQSEDTGKLNRTFCLFYAICFMKVDFFLILLVLVFGLGEVYWLPFVLSSSCGFQSLSKLETLALSFMFPLFLAILWSTVQLPSIGVKFSRAWYHWIFFEHWFSLKFSGIICAQVWRAWCFLHSEKIPITWECPGSCLSILKIGHPPELEDHHLKWTTSTR